MHLTLRLQAVSRPKGNQLPQNIVRLLQSTIMKAKHKETTQNLYWKNVLY